MSFRTRYHLEHRNPNSRVEGALPQDLDQEDADEPLEDQAEFDSVLISSADDLVAALATVLGADFTQAFQKFFPLISRFYVSS